MNDDDQVLSPTKADLAENIKMLNRELNELKVQFRDNSQTSKLALEMGELKAEFRSSIDIVSKKMGEFIPLLVSPLNGMNIYSYQVASSVIQ